MVFQNLYQIIFRSTYMLFFICLAVQCKSPAPFVDAAIQKTAWSDRAMVVTANPIATEVGMSVLRAGGNAVDAAIAVQLALAVVYPRAGNLGGGGFMVYRGNDGTTATLDYREKAPAAATRNMYLDQDSQVIKGLSQRDRLSAGVPGTVAGLYAAYDKYSRLQDFSRLIEPAIQLAKRGFGVTVAEANRLNDTLIRADFIKHNERRPVFVRDEAWQAGDKLVQPDLARTLTAIRDYGRDGFYKGWVADSIVAEMRRSNGIITKEDLATYQAKWRDPLVGMYKDYEVISMAPPSSGGIILVQVLEMLEDKPLAEWGFHSVSSVHAMVEAERRAYADRAQHMGDPDFWPVPTFGLISPKYARDRMSSFDLLHATPSNSIKAGRPAPKESEETTHFSIVDQFGNAVSVTTTLNDNYGSHTVVSGAGFILNDEMDDFSIKPGEPNMYGAVGGEANAIAPRKTMLSSMTPTIITKKGKLFMVVGTPGGTTIPTSVIQTFLNVTEYHMTATEAIAAKRFHHQHLPDWISMENGTLTDDVEKELTNMGHVLKKRSYIGLVECILVHPDGNIEGAADPRSDDSALGF